MAISYKPCSQCKKPVELMSVPSLSGEDGGYRIMLESVPALACADNHRRLIHPEFAMQLLDAIAKPESAGVYAASERGLLKKRSYCAKCGVELKRSALTSCEFRGIIPVESGAPMRVVLGAPCVKCSQCGTDQLPREQDLIDRVFKALARALRSADIHAE